MSLTAAAATPSVLRQNIMRMMEQTGLKGNAESQAELMEQILPALAQRLSTPAPPRRPSIRRPFRNTPFLCSRCCRCITIR